MTKILDLNFLGYRQTIAAFLLESTEGPVLIETGPHSTIKTLERKLGKAGYSMRDVRHVFLTHIHLDHAGAAWAFAEHGARIYMHSFGKRHMTDPSVLMDSVRRIYKDETDTLWGQMKGIAAEQIVTPYDREVTKVGNLKIRALHTPGHAKHHIAWQIGDDIFCGDVAGVKIGDGPVVPPCPPPDINIKDWLNSLGSIMLAAPQHIYLTHFGVVKYLAGHMDDLREILNDRSLWIKRKWEQGLSQEEIIPLFSAYTAHQLRERGVSDYGIKQYEAANPSWMNVAGLIRYWEKRTPE